MTASDQDSRAKSTLEPSVSSDRRRARELYRYFRPDEQSDPSAVATLALSHKRAEAAGALESPNIALTAYAQLVALRLNVQRAIISLIDRDTIYIVAESTRNTHLNNTALKDSDGQGLWVGCTDVPLAGRLCEWTIALSPHTATLPLFAIQDLSKDERSKNLPFVTGDPRFRYYAGTPLTTKRGINIGSLYVLDDVPHNGLSADEEDCLSGIAKAIMIYLETQRDAVIGRKMQVFTDTFNHFIEGDQSILPQTESPLQSPSSIAVSAITPTDPPASKQNDSHNADGMATNEASAQSDRSKLDSGATSSAEAHFMAFSRAANILRESMNIDDDGGVLFVDANNGLSKSSKFYPRREQPNLEENDSSEENTDIASSESFQRGEPQRPPMMNGQSSERASPTGMKDGAKILACSTAEDKMSRKVSGDTERTSQVEDAFLQELLEAYPNGKLWVFDEVGGLSSSDDEDYTRRGSMPAIQPTAPGRRRKEQEATCLLGRFPGARQLLFAPLWDAARSQWFSGCFVWNTVETQVYTADVELTYLMSFGRTVMAEHSRLNTVFADQQKGDFIGSISHELRSPLHGILASSEFLSETNIDAYQRSLTDTVDACGRTLLDTINHVLDYSKINSFERNWKRDKRRRQRGRGISHSSQGFGSLNATLSGAPSLSNIIDVVDVAAITEEVIEGVSVGHLLGTMNNNDITEVSRRSRRWDGTEKTLQDHCNVELVLDVEKEDWVFVTQPGALRRIIMNVFGNAIKYTSTGMIRLALTSKCLQKNEDHEISRMVTFIISDTGKGVSSDFMKSKLFTPFAQENSLAPGTGLGLSIVHGILGMLGGSINFQSELGVGTTVTMSLPLLRPKEPSSASTSSTLATPRDLESSLDSLRNHAEGKIIALCYAGAIPHGATSYVPDVLESLTRYIVDWFQLPLCCWSPDMTTDVIIVDEDCVSQVLRSQPLSTSGILVLCSNAAESRRRDFSKEARAPYAVEYLSKPFGPWKLARGLAACLKYGEEYSNSVRRTLPVILPDRSTAALGDTTGNLDFQSVLTGEEVGILVSNNLVADANSQNARKALNTPLDLEPHPEFPFPYMDGGSEINDKKIPAEVEKTSSGVPSGERTPTLGRPIPVLKFNRAPRILLVDDNAINLRLLQTFMKKRKYQSVDSASDGKMALEAFQESKDGYDIIFMDISMPIMNGFEATRAIRHLEDERRAAYLERKIRATPPALIIALTGLASGKDQSEAFDCGFDLYISKPASFKEIAKLLDNWESNADEG